MSRQRRRDTDPELALRRQLHALGYRYRVDAAVPGLPRRRADLLFAGAKVAVFVDGCFWHSCPVHATAPKSNATWWADKLRRNVARDAETDAHLSRIGWTVVRIWEHEPLDVAVERVRSCIKRTEVVERETN